MQLASVETKQYNVDGSITDVDGALAKNIHTQDYEFDDNGNMVSVSVAKNEEENPEGEQEATEEKDVLKSFLWDEENRLLAVNNNGSVSCYFYDAAGERTVKLTSESEMVHVNGKKVGGNANICKFTAYVSPYFVVSNGGAYTKHIYAASQRIASKLGNIDGFGADPRRVEMAGGKKISDFQKGNVGERFKALGYEYSAPEKEKVEKDSTMDSETEEKLIFFYHPDHLGSTSYVTDADGNIAQHIEYIPYGEVFVEERNNSFSTNFLFNAKELDNETGLYYYGARYLDPTGAMWLSVDPMWEKYAGMSPYNYCAGNPVKMVDPDGNSPVDDEHIKDAQAYVEEYGGSYTLQYNNDGYIDAIVTTTDGNVKTFKGTADNCRNGFYNVCMSLDAFFSEGTSDGANMGIVTDRDLAVGLGMTAFITGASSILTSIAAGVTGLAAWCDYGTAIFGLVNSVDDMVTDRNGESGFTRLATSESDKNKVKTVKIGVAIAGGVYDLYSGFKAGSNARSILDTKGNPKLHPKTKAPLIDAQSGVVDRTASVFDFIIDLGSTINSVIQY